MTLNTTTTISINQTVCMTLQLCIIPTHSLGMSLFGESRGESLGVTEYFCPNNDSRNFTPGLLSSSLEDFKTQTKFSHITIKTHVSM